MKREHISEFVHDEWSATLLDSAFPCVGGAGAVRRGDYSHRTYKSLESGLSADECARDLEEFLSSRDRADFPVSVFTASFLEPSSLDEEGFELALWRFLEMLRQRDQVADSVDEAGIDLDEPDDIGYVFGGRHLFIVGMHPTASRFARRFAFPTLVFNALSHATPLRETGRFERMADRIRARDIRLQHEVNPSIHLPRPAQFSGRLNQPGWECPHPDAMPGPH